MTGKKFDSEKPLLALIPPEALEEEGWVWTFGAKKYGTWNWTRGLAYTRILSAAMRHLVSIMKGEDVDPESGKLHAAHVRCCMGMLISFQLSNRNDLDDRLSNESTLGEELEDMNKEDQKYLQSKQDDDSIN